MYLGHGIDRTITADLFPLQIGGFAIQAEGTASLLPRIL
jgi:hypothetical protein